MRDKVLVNFTLKFFITKLQILLNHILQGLSRLFP